MSITTSVTSTSGIPALKSRRINPLFKKQKNKKLIQNGLNPPSIQEKSILKSDGDGIAANDSKISIDMAQSYESTGLNYSKRTRKYDAFFNFIYTVSSQN